MTDELNNPDVNIPPELQGAVTVTTLDKIYNWGRRNSMWPMFFGLACCAIEMICVAASRYDFSRFGMEVMRATPRQADMIIVSGTVTKKMVPQIVRLYNQIPEPKYVIAMGACASGGGPFKEGYSVVSGIDKFLPVDIYIPGCPPTPHQKGAEEAIPIPILGPDLIDPRDIPNFKELQAQALSQEADTTQDA
jgi:NADH-quinone oxidoreductase subunit B